MLISEKLINRDKFHSMELRYPWPMTMNKISNVVQTKLVQRDLIQMKKVSSTMCEMASCDNNMERQKKNVATALKMLRSIWIADAPFLANLFLSCLCFIWSQIWISMASWWRGILSERDKVNWISQVFTIEVITQMD